MAIKQNMYPKRYMSKQQKQLFSRGYIFNKDGQVYGFNPNKFAAYIQNLYEIIFAIERKFYSYEYGVWRKMEKEEFSKFIYDELEEIEEGLWESGNEREAIKALERLLLYDKEFNGNRHLINLQNGMYNTKTHVLLPHNISYFSSFQIPFEYNANATCPRFERYLFEVFEGDNERIKKAVEWLGYCMTAETKAQKALILFGGGSNGKGVFTEILSAMAGKANVSNIPLADLGTDFNRVHLFNKTVNIAAENEVGKTGFNSQFFKTIIGEDTITAAFKGVDGFTYKPFCKLVLSFNNLPYTNDKSEGYFRRLDFLPFTRHFSENEKDTDLKTKLLEELPGIFNLAMEGLEQLQANNYKFSNCRVSEQLLVEYKVELSPMLQFFDDKVVAGDEEKRIDNKIVYSAFKAWAKENGYKSHSGISNKAFWREFEAEAKRRKIETTVGHSNSYRYHTGIKLVEEYK